MSRSRKYFSYSPTLTLPSGEGMCVFCFFKESPSLFVLSLSKDGGRAGDGGRNGYDITPHHRV